MKKKLLSPLKLSPGGPIPTLGRRTGDNPAFCGNVESVTKVGVTTADNLDEPCYR